MRLVLRHVLGVEELGDVLVELLADVLAVALRRNEHLAGLRIEVVHDDLRVERTDDREELRIVQNHQLLGTALAAGQHRLADLKRLQHPLHLVVHVALGEVFILHVLLLLG